MSHMPWAAPQQIAVERVATGISRTLCREYHEWNEYTKREGDSLSYHA